MNFGKIPHSDSDIIDEENYHPPRGKSGSPYSLPFNDEDEFFDTQDGGSPKPNRNSSRKTPTNNTPSNFSEFPNEEGGGDINRDGNGEIYINLKNFAGLTSPPIKHDAATPDDISSLSSFSREESRRSSKDSEKIAPTVSPSLGISKATSGAMKLFKNIDYGHHQHEEGGDEDDDDEEEDDHIRPLSKAPEKYDFNLQTFRNINGKNNISSDRNLATVKEDHFDEESEEVEVPTTENTGESSSPRSPRAGGSQRSSSGGAKKLFLNQRHNSLKRRSVTINEEILLTSALFGLNEFQANAHNSNAKSLHTDHDGGGSTSEMFRDKLRLAQSLQGHEGPIWCMKFSPNGHYLATGGQDTRVLVWSIVSLPKSSKPFNSTDSSEGAPTNDTNSSDDLEEIVNPNLNPNPNPNPVTPERPESGNFGGNKRTSLKNHKSTSGEFSGLIKSFLHTEPYRVFEGHTHDITDLSWSKSNFLLSSSMDKTVRLWHASRNECLQFFRHPDIVTCVEFHPLHDRFFVSGCFDRRLRVWDIIPTGNVREWVSANDTITAVSFSPDGLTVAGGLIQGQIFFYEYEGMKYITQMDCRNRNGKYKKGSKVSGIAYYQRKDVVLSDGNNTSNSYNSSHAADHHGNSTNINSSSSLGHLKLETKSNAKSHINFHKSSSFFKRKGATVSTNQLLVTTNDNRIRLCQLEDYSTFCKYKGLKNRSMQIKASFSDDCEYIICGSEYGQVFLWKTYDEQIHSKLFNLNFLKKKDVLRNKLYENFDANEDHSAVIVAVFSPIESVRRYVKAHKDLLLELLTNNNIAQSWLQQHPNHGQGQGGGTSSGGAGEGSAHVMAELDRMSSPTSLKVNDEIHHLQLSTRMICTADFNGLIRVFFRIN